MDSGPGLLLKLNGLRRTGTDNDVRTPSAFAAGSSSAAATTGDGGALVLLMSGDGPSTALELLSLASTTSAPTISYACGARPLIGTCIESSGSTSSKDKAAGTCCAISSTVIPSFAAVAAFAVLSAPAKPVGVSQPALAVSRLGAIEGRGLFLWPGMRLPSRTLLLGAGGGHAGPTVDGRDGGGGVFGGGGTIAGRVGGGSSGGGGNVPGAKTAWWN